MGKGKTMETVEKQNDHDKGEDKNDLTLIVHAPRAPEPKTFTWAKTMKVSAAAALAAIAFGYSGTNAELQFLGQTPRLLDGNKTLVAEHLQDGDELEVTSTGGGV
jgi:hypothetical protein